MTGTDLTETGTANSRRTDLRLTAAELALLLLAALTLAATGTTTQVLGWAWERHANLLSWYIRPLFLLPLAYFSYKRWISGMVLTLIALATSIAWFPRPDRVEPMVAEFLAFERAWLTSGWSAEKALSWTLALAGLAAVCLAFWKRSLAYGLLVITTLAVGKMAWGVVEGRGSGWAMLVPALAGLVICNGAVLVALSRLRRRRSAERSRTAGTDPVGPCKDPVASQSRPSGTPNPNSRARSKHRGIPPLIFTKERLMRTIEATVVINAPSTAVWEVLTESERYADWNPFITVVSGQLTRGSRPTLRITPPGKRTTTFRPRVTESSPKAGLRWRGRLVLPGLCDADHQFNLTPVTDGRTRLVQRETFRGLLVPFLASMLEPTRQGFEAMNAALRERVEAGTPFLSTPACRDDSVSVQTAARAPEQPFARGRGNS